MSELLHSLQVYLAAMSNLWNAKRETAKG